MFFLLFMLGKDMYFVQVGSIVQYGTKLNILNYLNNFK